MGCATSGVMVWVSDCTAGALIVPRAMLVLMAKRDWVGILAFPGTHRSAVLGTVMYAIVAAASVAMIVRGLLTPGVQGHYRELIFLLFMSVALGSRYVANMVWLRRQSEAAREVL